MADRNEASRDSSDIQRYPMIPMIERDVEYATAARNLNFCGIVQIVSQDLL
jgi:hypothetical protein